MYFLTSTSDGAWSRVSPHRPTDGAIARSDRGSAATGEGPRKDEKTLETREIAQTPDEQSHGESVSDIGVARVDGASYL